MLDELLSGLKNFSPSVFVKICIISVGALIPIYLLTVNYPNLLPPSIASILSVLMIFIWVFGLILELNYSIFNVYEKFTGETLRYAKSISAGIAGGLVISISTDFSPDPIKQVSDFISVVLVVLVQVAMILLVLVAGLAIFIVIDRHHSKRKKAGRAQ